MHSEVGIKCELGRVCHSLQFPMTVDFARLCSFRPVPPQSLTSKSFLSHGAGSGQVKRVVLKEESLSLPVTAGVKFGKTPVCLLEGRLLTKAFP